MKSICLIIVVFVSLCFRMTPQQEFVVIQNNEWLGFNAASKEINLKKKEFRIRFYSKEYLSDSQFSSTRIAMLDYEQDYSEVQVGDTLTKISFFSPGTGYACSREGNYTYFTVLNKDQIGHHYIVYERKGDKRASLVGEVDGLMLLEVNIDQLRMDGSVIDVKEVEKKIYLIVVNDMNLNGVIDEGEMGKAILNFQ